MTITVYLFRYFLKVLLICSITSYSVFYIFSLIGNLGEKLSFETILLISGLNALQILTYIPSHLFILSIYLFTLNLNSRNELLIIKEYLELKNILLIMLPILTIFIIIENNKDSFSDYIEKSRTNLITLNNLEDTKIYISNEGNKKSYTVVKQNDENSRIFNQLIKYTVENQSIIEGIYSKDLILVDNDLFSNNSIIYTNNEFQNDKSKKKLFGNFIELWNDNSRVKNLSKLNKVNYQYDIIYNIFFYSLFYFCIQMIFLSKNLVGKNLKTNKIFFLTISIFLYSLIIPKVTLSNYNYIFELISLMVFLLIFLKIKIYE